MVRFFTPKARKLPHGMNLDDPSLVGISAHLGPGSKELIINVVSNNPEGGKIALNLWNTMKVSARLESVHAKTATIVVPTPEGAEAAGRIFSVLCAIAGHAIFI